MYLSRPADKTYPYLLTKYIPWTHLDLSIRQTIQPSQLLWHSLHHKIFLSSCIRQLQNTETLNGSVLFFCEWKLEVCYFLLLPKLLFWSSTIIISNINKKYFQNIFLRGAGGCPSWSSIKIWLFFMRIISVIWRPSLITKKFIQIKNLCRIKTIKIHRTELFDLFLFF